MKKSPKPRKKPLTAPVKVRRQTVADLRRELSITQQEQEKLDDRVRGLEHQLRIIGQAFKGDIV